MLLPTLRVFLALAVVYLPSTAVFAFQPGADYGLYKTTNLYNCSGTVLTSNVTARNSVDTLPQIEPLSDAGWEQWDFFMHGTFPIIMRWYQGDQSDCSSTPSVGKIDVAILDVNGTNVQTTLVGPLTYKNDAGVKAISIGDNTFHWDNSTQWYNLTLNVDGYSLVLNTYSCVRLLIYSDNALTRYIGPCSTRSIRTLGTTMDDSAVSEIPHSMDPFPLPVVRGKEMSRS